MMIAKVVGNLWSTKKNEKINALRLLIVQPLGKDMAPKGDLVVVADEIGAGADELVIISQGAPAMQAFERKEPIPVDAVVIAIVDSWEMAGKKAGSAGK